MRRVLLSTWTDAIKCCTRFRAIVHDGRLFDLRNGGNEFIKDKRRYGRCCVTTRLKGKIKDRSIRTRMNNVTGLSRDGT